MKRILSILLILIITINISTAQETKKITMADIWATYTFYPKSVSGLLSMKDGENYTILNLKRDIDKYSYKSGKKVNTIFSLRDVKDDVKPKAISEYWFSADESKILISSDVEKIYRHSFKADYYIWNMKSQKIVKLSENGKQQLATFSPDGSKVAFVRDNNIFIVDLDSGKEKQITTDGKVNYIINGAPDWVYEEEFAFAKAFEWSPNSESIAYLRFDESAVKEFNMTMYGELYPTWYKFKYPKAGEDNAIVTLHIYNLKTDITKKVDTGKETDQYIPRIKWTKNPNILSYVRLNRLQNNYELFLVETTKFNNQLIYNEKDKRYVDIEETKYEFLDNGNQFVLLSEKNGYSHLYLYDINGKLIKQLTQGKYEVTDFLGYDSKNEIFYYQSNEISPMLKHLYSVKLDGTKKQLTKKRGTNEVSFSKGFKYFINTNSTANSPEYITLHNAKGKEKRVLEDNADVKQKMKDFGFVKKEFFSLKTTENVQLNGWMMKPANFDENKKYPVYVFLYGGPGNQQVNDAWDYNTVWYQFLTQHGYIVACVDNRGTGGRGAEFKKLTYGQLGKYETIDQIEAAKYYQSLPYVDKNRIGIQGWSYGGYMSTLCLEKGADVFKMAIAVAPVINWRYYDSIYTERYMGLPKDNANGYDDNSPINHVKKIKGKYLLVHGSADDNVHFQNSMELVNALVNANKQFDMQFYVNKNHGIYGGYTRYHLFTKMFDFVQENL